MNQPKQNKNNEKGSILVESAVSIAFFITAFLLILELVRAAYLHIGLEQAAFIWTRGIALGLSASESKREVYDFLEAMFGNEKRREFERNLDFSEKYENRAITGRVHYRYEQLLRFGLRKNGGESGQEKHHLEITKKCRFPGYSR